MKTEGFDDFQSCSDSDQPLLEPDFFSAMRLTNGVVFPVVAGALLFLGIVLYVPFFVHLFRFSALHSLYLFLCIVAGIGSVPCFEAVKWFVASRLSRKRM
ncbi:MAG: cation transporting ATPase C-terminal domain-containing protein [Pelodictyon phaeoclathratiforme]|jgi:Ca2+-transporting ATPase|uniref:Cation-transporting P-type ATPase C-terminal domain-containing protein n=2 Tax=Pelodictyon phaeoclathratiforme TaxID=34090 RepID=B4SGP4_PELPB|nr:hypothetical protein Ppha_1184 [Pelodictyon phaeoclathratiforme BU-1]MBV5290170.1 cation transporting ATPase C-terminal domain-containing protein [Pelodictyon phaeoclathratiforme]